MSEKERWTQYTKLANDAKASNNRIDAIHTANAAIQRRVDTAETESRNANARAQATIVSVHKSNADTNARLTETTNLAKQAAAKAGVYRLPDATRKALLTVLTSTKPSTALVSCYSSMESACRALSDVFISAGWKVIPLWGQRFYTGVGLDAPIDPDRDTGLIVWYATGKDRLGREIAGALSGSGFAVDSRLDSVLKTTQDATMRATDIVLGVRFLRQ